MTDEANALTTAQRQILVTHICAELDRMCTTLMAQGIPREDLALALAEQTSRIVWNAGGQEFAVKFMRGVAELLAQYERPVAN